MAGLLRVSDVIDAISRFFAWIAAWLVLLSCLISAGNAVSRYLFSASSNAWLEIQWQMFAGIFLLGAAYVLKLNEHVRVDLLYGGAPPRRKLWIDVIGLVFFLFPSVLIIGYFAWGFFLASFRSGESLVERRRAAALAGEVPAALRAGAPAPAGGGGADPADRRAARRRPSETIEYERPLQ